MKYHYIGDPLGHDQYKILKHLLDPTKAHTVRGAVRALKMYRGNIIKNVSWMSIHYRFPVNVCLVGDKINLNVTDEALLELDPKVLQVIIWTRSMLPLNLDSFPDDVGTTMLFYPTFLAELYGMVAHEVDINFVQSTWLCKRLKCKWKDLRSVIDADGSCLNYYHKFGSTRAASVIAIHTKRITELYRTQLIA